MSKHLISIVGPTAIGKTSLSIKLAQHYNTEIISADSRQFYKEMCIGTAVPSKKELEIAKHHFIQNRSIQDNYDVGSFEKDAINLINKLFKKHNALIMVGGSGLYVKAITHGLNDFPDVDPKLREKLNTIFKEEGLQPLREQLREVDLKSFKTIDLNNPHRVLRALEVSLSSGKAFSSFLKPPLEDRNFTVQTIGLMADRSLIYDRINRRVDQMIEDGLVEEVATLINHKSINALNTVGYKEIIKYLSGEWSLDFAISEIKKNTRRFAKRQMTWFKKDSTIEWFKYDTDLDSIIDYLDLKMN